MFHHLLINMHSDIRKANLPFISKFSVRSLYKKRIGHVGDYCQLATSCSFCKGESPISCCKQTGVLYFEKRNIFFQFLL